MIERVLLICCLYFSLLTVKAQVSYTFSTTFYYTDSSTVSTSRIGTIEVSKTMIYLNINTKEFIKIDYYYGTDDSYENYGTQRLQTNQSYKANLKLPYPDIDMLLIFTNNQGAQYYWYI